jgi:mRNA-degrading endonuclease RelE of RelBE toxin-antitoxin system
MRIAETPHFRKTVKRLHKNQKHDVDAAVRAVAENPAIGDQKKGNLAWLRVYKFRMVNQLTLLAYEHRLEADTLILHGVGSHENFYRDLKPK